jgi:NAD(P)-dependent dehydrogenase (short-subunit alcohol dehydrogenase family)
MKLHVFSSFLIMKEACGRMKSGSSIALISSVAVQTGLPNHESIAAAKGAIEGITRSAAATYAPKGIRVNAVAPGLTETPATAALCKEPARKVSEKMHPLGRIGKPQDIASALAWLIDPENSWVTGQILHVDGGLGQLRKLPTS